IDHSKQGIVIMDPVQIRQHYLQGWFPVDLVSSLPLDFFVLNWPAKCSDLDRRSTLSQLGKLISFIELIKISRLFRHGGCTEQIMGTTFLPTSSSAAVTRMSRCNSSTTVEIVEGGSCPSRSRSPSPSVCIMSATEPRPPSPSVCIVTESSRPPSPSVIVVKEEARSPSFSVARSKRTSSPTTVYVVSEGEQQPPRKPARSPNVCIVTSSSPPPRRSPDVCIVTEDRPPSPGVCIVSETRRSPSPRVEVIETPRSSSSTIVIEE
ncbi:hypothetical protein MTO96_045007, partial [Rhipicephalus appendiculatus]